MDSKLAFAARADLQDQVRKLTPEQRLNAFLQHCQLVAALVHSGRAVVRTSGRPRR